MIVNLYYTGRTGLETALNYAEQHANAFVADIMTARPWKNITSSSRFKFQNGKTD